MPLIYHERPVKYLAPAPELVQEELALTLLPKSTPTFAPKPTSTHILKLILALKPVPIKILLKQFFKTYIK